MYEVLPYLSESYGSFTYLMLQAGRVVVVVIEK